MVANGLRHPTIPEDTGLYCESLARNAARALTLSFSGIGGGRRFFVSVRTDPSSEEDADCSEEKKNL